MVEKMSLFEFIVLISYVASIVGVIFIIITQIKKERKKHDEKFATKEDVNFKINTMDKRMSGIEYDVETHRKENQQAHRDIINDIIQHMDTRFKDLKDLINSK